MPERAYGHDETSDFATLAEAEHNKDGTITLRVVQVDKRASSGSLPQIPLSGPDISDSAHTRRV